MSRVARRLGLLLLQVAVTLVVGAALTEAAVRLLGLAPELPSQYVQYVTDPVLPHKPRAGSVISGRATTGEFDFHYAHNSSGLRDVEHPLPKPSGAFRVLGLGDSFAYGAGASFENTFLSRLEVMLNGRDGSHPRVEVIRAGIPRYFPEAERLFLEHYGLAYQPDLVLVAFVPNDVIDTYLGLDAIQVASDGSLVSNYGARLLQQLGASTLWLYTHVHMVRIPIRAYLSRQHAEERPVRWPEVFRPDGAHEEAWREVERQYERMIALARGAGAEIAFLHIPLGKPMGDAAYPPRRLAEWAARNRVAFFDALPALSSHTGGDPLYWPRDGHPSDAGHAVIAQVLYDGLVARQLVP